MRPLPGNVKVLPAQPYLEQAAGWPKSGRHILAHSDETSVVVYQAYRLSIARYALAHGEFGGSDFSFSRMTWIKPNFLWMMYRSNWAMSEGQEMILGIRLSRTFFERILVDAVPSSYSQYCGDTHSEWQGKLSSSEVRLQWDPDHDPSGRKLERRAIQLGLRGGVLRAFATSEIRELFDMTPFVVAQRSHVKRNAWTNLLTPIETIYTPLNSAAAENVGLDTV